MFAFLLLWGSIIVLVILGDEMTRLWLEGVWLTGMAGLDRGSGLLRGRGQADWRGGVCHTSSLGGEHGLPSDNQGEFIFVFLEQRVHIDRLVFGM